MSAKEYERMLRCDPCSYCGGPGGTIDHIDPRPVRKAGRRSWTNLTGACERCNRTKDKGKDGGHRSVPMMLRDARQSAEREERVNPESFLEVGMPVAGPFFERGVITGFVAGPRGRRGVLVWLSERDEVWRCANPLALRPLRASGGLR